MTTVTVVTDVTVDGNKHFFLAFVTFCISHRHVIGFGGNVPAQSSVNPFFFVITISYTTK